MEPIRKENWKELKTKLQQQFSDLTDNDLLLVEGKEDVLIGRIQNKSGRKREEIVEVINKIQSGSSTSNKLNINP